MLATSLLKVARLGSSRPFFELAPFARTLGAIVCTLPLLMACNRSQSAATSSAPPLASVAPVVSAHVQIAEPEAMPEVAVVCQRFANAPVPTTDLPNDAERAGLHDCDAEALYYGIDKPADFVRARQCAYGEKRSGDPAVAARPEILMMIYANGSGVPVNFDLALRFACQTEVGVPAELAGRVTRLWNARAGTPLAEPFDRCQDATSSITMGDCAAHRERVDAALRKARKLVSTAGMPAVELDALEGAAKRYFDTRAEKEVDHSGTLASSFAISTRTKLEDDLADALEKLHDPAFVPQGLHPRSLDDELSRTLSRIAVCQGFIQNERLNPLFVSRAGIQATEQRWLAYRQAFIALARKLHPDTKSDIWRAWITQARLSDLQEFAGGC